MTDGWKKREIADGVGLGGEDGQRKKAGGLLIAIRSKIGKNNSTLYELVQQDGESLQVWGSTTIDGKLNPSDIGKFVKFEYLGMAVGNSGRKYKDIVVSVWEAELNDAMREWPRVGEFYELKQDDRNEPALDDEEDDDLPF